MPNRIFIDIETIPGPDRPSVEDLQVPGQMKKPETIQKWKEETAPDLLDQIWHGQSLDDFKGEIASIGWGFENHKPRVKLARARGQEKEILGKFNAAVMRRLRNTPGYAPGVLLETNLTWIGFNIRPFDLPWLRHRAIKYGFHALARVIPWTRYAKNVIDLREVWNHGDMRAKGTLDDVAGFLGLEGKKEIVCPLCTIPHAPKGNVVVGPSPCPVCNDSGHFVMDGSKVWDLWRNGCFDALAQYQQADVELTRKLYRRMFRSAALGGPRKKKSKLPPRGDLGEASASASASAQVR